MGSSEIFSQLFYRSKQNCHRSPSMLSTYQVAIGVEHSASLFRPRGHVRDRCELSLNAWCRPTVARECLPDVVSSDRWFDSRRTKIDAQQWDERERVDERDVLFPIAFSVREDSLALCLPIVGVEWWDLERAFEIHWSFDVCLRWRSAVRRDFLLSTFHAPQVVDVASRATKDERSEKTTRLPVSLTCCSSSSIRRWATDKSFWVCFRSSSMAVCFSSSFCWLISLRIFSQSLLKKWRSISGWIHFASILLEFLRPFLIQFHRQFLDLLLQCIARTRFDFLTTLLQLFTFELSSIGRRKWKGSRGEKIDLPEAEWWFWTVRWDCDWVDRFLVDIVHWEIGSLGTVSVDWNDQWSARPVAFSVLRSRRRWSLNRFKGQTDEIRLVSCSCPSARDTAGWCVDVPIDCDWLLRATGRAAAFSLVRIVDTVPEDEQC